MIRLERTDSNHSDFQMLVAVLDKDLKIRDGEDHAFFAQFNKTDTIKHVVVAYENDVAVGCGAIKHYDEKTMEIKRMFVLVPYRGNGIASSVLAELETWSRELNYQQCILETGEKQPEAIRLYHKNHYTVIPNFGQYAGVISSVCFQKTL
ncbi:MAG TPA: GNAT family N-acetyltransferase [Flavipsychrobacter sp.]|nr:GNAT family N-acetyltransferase [Flavipsychrobacter sp.]